VISGAVLVDHERNLLIEAEKRVLGRQKKQSVDPQRLVFSLAA
jgi:hypothetical protein